MSIHLPKISSIRRIRRLWRGTVIGIVVGIVSGLGGIVFNFLLEKSAWFFTGGFMSLILPGEVRGYSLLGFPLERWMMLWIPALGGILSGFLVFTFAPEAEGHGTDAMIESFHRKKGVVRWQVPIVKTIASAITIGSGGSAGKEGPIAQIGSGFASVFASVLRLSDKERRILLLAGAAGGIGAIFKAPLGAALFATEVLYSKADFEFEAIIPCILSSIVGFMVFILYDGSGTIFRIPAFTLATPLQLPLYGVFGIICAVVGFLYVRFFYGIRDKFFKKINLPKAFLPAFGGLLLGVVAFFLPQVLAGGYGWVQSAINGEMALGLMLGLVFAKIVATSFTISSGGSGGVFAPSLYIGSMLGGWYGGTCARFFPQVVTEPAAFVLVGMGGFFAGVAKVPIAALIMVAEMTGGYSLIVPMMIVSSISYLLLGQTSLYEKQVNTMVDSPAHIGDFAVDVMDHMVVKDAMVADKQVTTIFEGMPFQEVMRCVVDSSQQDFPVVDREEKLTGILSITDLREAMFTSELHDLLVAKDIAMGGVVTVTLGDTLNTALGIMAALEVRELPVVSEDDSRRIIGIISRKDITRAYHEEMERMRGRSA